MTQSLPSPISHHPSSRTGAPDSCSQHRAQTEWAPGLQLCSQTAQARGSTLAILSRSCLFSKKVRRAQGRQCRGWQCGDAPLPVRLVPRQSTAWLHLTAEQELVVLAVPSPGGSQGLAHGSSSPSAGSSELLTTCALPGSPVRHKALPPLQ